MSATAQDSKQRCKVYLETYLTDANLTKDDDSTEFDFSVMYDNLAYSPIREFLPYDDYCVMFLLGDPDSQPEMGHNKVPVAYDEMQPITISCIDREGATAAKTKWKAERDLRRILESYPYGSVRSMNKRRDATVKFGGTTIYQTVFDLRYRRSSEVVPTAPTFAYTIGFTCECDRLSGGTEGTWTLSAGAGSTCTQEINSERNLYLNQTVFSADSSTVNGTSLGLSSTLYGRVRIRYKTSGNATAKVILGFDVGTQTVLAETASSTFTVVDVAVTAAKTINTITLYCCDGTGTVTYDFIQIYSGNYILPNVAQMTPPFTSKDVVVGMPSYSGDPSQGLGSHLLEVRMRCDLGMEPSVLTWKRPQTSGSKTDYNNSDALMELLQLCGISTAWTWLKLGSPAMQFKARIIEVNPDYAGESDTVELVWREYRHGNANNETAKERFGLSLT